MAPHLYDKHLSLDIHCVPNTSLSRSFTLDYHFHPERGPLPLSPRRARRHRRQAPRITLPSTILQHSTGICKERDGREVRARLPASNTQAEVETIPSSNLNESSTSVQPQTSDEGAVDVSALPPGLVLKLGLIGGIEVEGLEAGPFPFTLLWAPFVSCGPPSEPGRTCPSFFRTYLVTYSGSWNSHHMIDLRPSSFYVLFGPISYAYKMEWIYQS